MGETALMTGSGSWAEATVMTVRLLAAFVLAVPIGWERDHRHHSPGLRTFPLVSMGACAFLLLGQIAFGESKDAEARVLQGLLGGIGFIGAGAILKGREHVHGVVTAVAIWITAAVGAAAAYGIFEMAVILSLVTLLTLRLLRTPTYRRRPAVRDTGAPPASAPPGSSEDGGGRGPGERRTDSGSPAGEG